MLAVKHVVIIDDSPYKIRDIEDTIGRIYPGAAIESFGTAGDGLSYLTVDALDEVKADPESWLVLTDMQMPIMRGTGIDRAAGRHVLKELHSRLFLHELAKVNAVVISGDDQDPEWMGQLFSGCIGCIRYSPFVSLESQLRGLLEEA